MSIQIINAVTGYMDPDGNYHLDWDAIPEDVRSNCRQRSAGTYKFENYRELKEFLDAWEARDNGTLYLYSIDRGIPLNGNESPNLNYDAWYLRAFFEGEYAPIKTKTELSTAAL